MESAVPETVGSETLATELQELRQGILPVFMIAAPVLGWLWLLHVTIAVLDLRLNCIPTIALTIGPYLAFRAQRRSYHLACWLIVLSLLVSWGALRIRYPQDLTLAYGVLIPLVTHTLLSARAAIAIGVAQAVLTVVAPRFLTSLMVPSYVSLIGVAIMAGLALGIVALAASPLRRSIETALAGWEQNRAALEEVRERRGELYRVVRALDEASYRIERMNNDLILARHEAELARSNHARFAAAVSHELRAPLNLVMGFAGMIVETPERYDHPLPAEYREDVETIYRNSKHMTQLVDDVLDLSQIDADSLPLVRDQLDLDRDIIGRGVEIMRPVYERKGLYLRTEIARDLPCVWADAVRMRQVLLNLLSNALRHTEQGGVTVRAELVEDEITVSVRDTGTGITPADLPRLFGAFQQLASDARNREGSGLGLSISKDLVELHGGRIWAESEPGRGSAFRFTLPLPGRQPSALLATGSRHDAREPVGRDQNNCLLIGSDPDVVRSLGRLLEGYRVVAVPMVEDGFEAIEALHPRVVISDESTAARLTSWLEKSSYDIPVVACSALTPFHDGDMVLAHLVKPITDRTIRMITHYLHRLDEGRVLVVDDDPAAVRLIKRLLAALPNHFSVSTATDGRAALESMRDAPPDLVLLDLAMPGMSGSEVIDEMRHDPRLAGVRVVIISAIDRSEQTLSVGQRITVMSKGGIRVRAAGRLIRCALAELTPNYLGD